MNNFSDFTSSVDGRFLTAMQQWGLDPGDGIIADGHIHRFSTNGDLRDTAGWYVLELGNPSKGAFGCYRSGVNEKWIDDPLLSAGELADATDTEDTDQVRDEAQRRAAKDSAFRTWTNANDDPLKHPYLESKNIGSYGLRCSGDTLFVPVFDRKHELTSLQQIDQDGKKRFFRGCSTKGGFHLIGQPGETICIAEGYATAASIHEATGLAVYVSFGASNLKNVAEYVRAAHTEADIIVCADNDWENEQNPGLTHATRAAIATGSKLAVPSFGPCPPENSSDFNDLLALAGAETLKSQVKAASYPHCGEYGDLGKKRGLGGFTDWQGQGEKAEDMRKILIASAVEVARERILAKLAPSIEYPVDALGPLEEVCRVISQGVQVDPAIVGQSLIAAASLLSQSVMNVRAIESAKPLSLYCLTIAESGDGKSTVESIVLAAINAYQRSQTAEYQFQLERYAIELKAARKSGADPIKPKQPYRLMRDATIEGIRKAFQEGVPSQGLYTSEAAAMLHGYGMSPDHRAKTAANLNALWDSGELSVARVTGERVQLYDRRFAMHWMIQPSAAAKGLTDALLTEIGLWPRFLVSWPSPGKPRRFAPFDPAKEPVIGRYWQRCTELLSLPLEDSCEGLPVLPPDENALQIFQDFFENMEDRAKGEPADLADVRVFASRATELAFRVAGVLAVFGGEEVIGQKLATCATRLILYSVQNWQAIHGERSDNEHRLHAVTLYKWLLERKGSRSDLTSILRNGPRVIRSRSRRDTALAILKHSGLVVIDSGEVQGILADPDFTLRQHVPVNRPISPNDSAGGT